MLYEDGLWEKVQLGSASNKSLADHKYEVQEGQLNYYSFYIDAVPLLVSLLVLPWH